MNLPNGNLYEEFHHHFQRLLEEIKQSLCRELDSKGNDLFLFFLAKMHATMTQLANQQRLQAVAGQTSLQTGAPGGSARPPAPPPPILLPRQPYPHLQIRGRPRGPVTIATAGPPPPQPNPQQGQPQGPFLFRPQPLRPQPNGAAFPGAVRHPMTGPPPPPPPIRGQTLVMHPIQVPRSQGSLQPGGVPRAGLPGGFQQVSQAQQLRQPSQAQQVSVISNALAIGPLQPVAIGPLPLPAQIQQQSIQQQQLPSLAVAQSPGHPVNPQVLPQQPKKSTTTQQQTPKPKVTLPNPTVSTLPVLLQVPPLPTSITSTVPTLASQASPPNTPTTVTAPSETSRSQTPPQPTSPPGQPMDLSMVFKPSTSSSNSSDPHQGNDPNGSTAFQVKAEEELGPEDDQSESDCHCTECDELLIVSEEEEDHAGDDHNEEGSRNNQAEPGNSQKAGKRQRTQSRQEEDEDSIACISIDVDPEAVQPQFEGYLEPTMYELPNQDEDGPNIEEIQFNCQEEMEEDIEDGQLIVDYAEDENSNLENPPQDLGPGMSPKRKDPPGDDLDGSAGPSGASKVRHFKTLSVTCLLDHCPAKFTQLPQLDEHLVKDHGILPHRCVMHGCTLSFSSTYELGRHYRHDHQGDGTIKVWQCSKCGMKSKGNHYLLKHMYNYHYEGLFKCAKDDCTYQAKYRQAVVNHYRRNHLPVPERFEAVPPFGCAIESCGKSFRNEEGLLRHQMVVHQAREHTLAVAASVSHLEAPPPAYSEPHSYAYQILALGCFVDECNEILRTAEELEGHLEQMHNIQPYRCHLCNISFEDIRYLDQHLCETHQGLLEWPCSRCDHKRKSHHALANHMLKFHYEGHFLCSAPACGSLASVRIDAIRHYQRHHCEYTCKYEHCGAVFRAKECLRAHESSEHAGERDAFVCGQCGKPFSTKGNLKTHQRIHLGVKPFVCRFDGCGKAFRAKEHLTIHERTHSGIKPYRCTWPECGHHTTDRSSMIAHVRGFHFRLPYKLKEQKERNIIDDRDPRQFVEVIPELLKYESYFHVFN